MNYSDLVDECLDKDFKERELYLKEFFQSEKYLLYETSNDIKPFQKEAIKTLFNDDCDLMGRINNALKIDKFCKEAIFLYIELKDESRSFELIESYIKMNEYDSLDNYSKESYIQILDLIINFLSCLSNFTKASKVLLKKIELNGVNDHDLARLVVVYAILEKADEIYNLYKQYGFNTSTAYLMAIVCELKNDDKVKAKELYLDMREKIKESDYIDHIWDLKEDQSDFSDALEDCFDDICNVPYFFSFCKECKEHKYS